MLYGIPILSLVICTGLAAIIPKLDHPASASWSPDQSCIIPPITDEQVKAQLAVYKAGNGNTTNTMDTIDTSDDTNDRDTTQYGGASLFNYINWGGPQKWTDIIYPGRTAVVYCFASSTERDQLHERVEAAINLWKTALGGERGKENAHDLQFMEWYDFKAFKHHLCYDQKSGNKHQWNPSLPTTTVVIRLVQEQMIGARATMGAGGEANKGTPWKLLLQIGPDAPASIVAHEIGHVLGMGHEHQRTDRDRHVEFDCTKISGYSDALAEARRTIPRFKDHQLCLFADYSYKFKFPAVLYTMSVGYGSPAQYWWMKADTEYDVDSTMSYSSFQYASTKCTMGGHPEECPLRRWKVPGDKSQGISYIDHPEKPSPGDVRWIRINYPYQGPHIDSVKIVSTQDEEKETQTEQYGWDPYVERGKVTGENPKFLRDLDLRREKLVSEEKAARKAATAHV